MGLSDVHAISLKAAQERAAEWCKRLSDSVDPPKSPSILFAPGS
jgi:hypothetical protein